jgi:hypothetical protein
VDFFKKFRTGSVRSLVDCMGVCHSLGYLKGKLIGDPLDIEMMETTEFRMLQEEEESEVRESD